MKGILTNFKFVGKISKIGDNRVVWIPKQYHEKIMDLEDKQVRVMIEDEISTLPIYLTFIYLIFRFNLVAFPVLLLAVDPLGDVALFSID
jgi:hypothetical protein